MELDRQSIERRDFPISRRGYEPASVDAHMRAVAAEVAALREQAQQPGGESLALTAGSQVQGILQAAENTASEIVSQAQQSASQTRHEADQDARRTRDEAISQAQAHIATVSRASASLLERVEALDGEVGAVVQSVRSAASRLSGDLVSLEASMAELYDAAAGNGPIVGQAQAPTEKAPHPGPAPSPPVPAAPIAPAPPLPDPVGSEASQVSATSDLQTPPSADVGQAQALTPQAASLPLNPDPPEQPAPPVPAAQPQGSGDLDGARLIALNMALNGDSREETNRYLADHFQLEDRQRLIDEVYAAIEG